MASTGKIILQVVDGARQPITGDIDIRLFDGDKNGGELITHRGPTIILENIPCFNNTRDFYTVLASGPRYVQAGYFPAKVGPNILRPVFLMLLPKDGGFNFNRAHWADIQVSHPEVPKLLADRDRYEAILEEQEAVAAGMWNILTGLSQLPLAEGSALSYFRKLRWEDSLAQDRF